MSEWHRPSLKDVSSPWSALTEAAILLNAMVIWIAARIYRSGVDSGSRALFPSSDGVVAGKVLTYNATYRCQLHY